MMQDLEKAIYAYWIATTQAFWIAMFQCYVIVPKNWVSRWNLK